MLSEAERAHLERAIYPPALAAAGEPDTGRNREIAASDYWQFLERGGGSDEAAVAALTRGLRGCVVPERGPPSGPGSPLMS